jgi:hypothetical protein
MTTKTKSKAISPSTAHFVAEMSPMVRMAAALVVSTALFILIGYVALQLHSFTHHLKTSGLDAFFVMVLTGVEYGLFIMDIVLYGIILVKSFITNIKACLETV